MRPKPRFDKGEATVALALVAFWWALLTPAWGQKEELTPARPAPSPERAGVSAPGPEIPLRISAAQLEADQEKRLITFSGQVKAEYGDSVLYADKLLVFYQPQKEGRPAPPAASKGPGGSPLGDLGGDKLERLEARGNVRFVQGDRVATAEQAVYRRQLDEIVLSGRPQVWRGENHLRGTRIIIRLASRKVLVEGSPQQRVEAYLYQSPGKSRGQEVPFPKAEPGPLTPAPGKSR